MVRADIPGINTVTKKLADGSKRVYRYHRATGARLNGRPGSPEFTRDLAAAEKSMRDRLAGTFNGLIRDYSLSPEFEMLRDSTKRQYRRMLTAAEKKFGDMPIAALEDYRVTKDLLSWRAEVAMASGAREADNRLGTISAMLTWGKRNGRIDVNHLRGFQHIYRNDRSDVLWLPEHVTAFMAVAPVPLQRALILALHSGQRQGDLLRLSWGNYDGAWIRLRQGKGRRRVEIPCTQTLKNMLDGIDRGAATVVLTTAGGRPWTGKNFRQQWKAACRSAGIPDELHFHDIRGTTVTLLAQAGCSVPQIGSITGHSLKEVGSILEKYLSRTGALAGGAIALFENAQSTRFANRLQIGAPKLVKGNAK